MSTYKLNKVNAEGSARLDPQTGKTYQLCTVSTEIVENTYPNKFVQNDLVEFEVNSSMTIADAWINIQTVQAPAWIAANYPNT